MPVIAALPFWALLYSGAFGARPSTGPATPVEHGQAVYRSAGCSTCHGATGGGGVGPALANVTKTFPNFADHIAWVTHGSASVKGQPYGASGRVATGGMPAFGDQLSAEEIVAVVCHERVDYAHETPVPAACQPGGAAAAAATTSP
jgi:mono/diheme cytochrome c family protein